MTIMQIDVSGVKLDAVIEKHKDGYTGTVPALPGCASQGDGFNQCRENLTDASRAWLEVWARRTFGSAPSPDPEAAAAAYGGYETLRSFHQQRVDEFMCKAGQDVPDKPAMPDEKTRLLRARLILEEALETVEALGFMASVEIESSPDGVKFHGTTLYSVGTPDLVKAVDGCCDLRVVTTGTLTALGVADLAVQKAVDESNLAKFEPPKCPHCGGAMLWDGSPDGANRWYCDNHRTAFPTRPQEDGPYKREDGKWIKPPYWKEPDLAAVLKAAGWDGKE